ncbi:MAG: serine hydrolase, partial [Anaerolineales bacterium]|nr:serine hydrolase [Anaerolineales bacterium]
MSAAHSHSDLAATLHQLADTLAGTAGLVVYCDDPVCDIAINADVLFPAASLIKLPVLWAYYQEVVNGRLHPDQLVPIPPDAVVGGCGVITNLAPGLTLRLGDLARLMIILSDNTATNMVIEQVGLAQIAATCQQLGLHQTALQRKLMDYAARDRGLENTIAPGDVGALLRRLWRHDGLPAAVCQEMIDILHRQMLRGKLPVLLPQEAWLAHKTGEIPGCEHDAGILRCGGETAVIVVMT